MGISDDIRLTKKSSNKKKSSQKLLGPDEIKIKYSRAEDKTGDTSLKYQRSQMEDDFFDDNKEKHEIPELEDKKDELTEKYPEVKYKEDDYHQPKKQGNPMTKWVILLILVLTTLLVWQNWSKISKAIGWESNPESSNKSLPNYSSTTKNTDYTSSSTSINTPTDTPTQNTSATTTADIDKSKITIQILNGNGISGSANNVKTQLVNAGFTVDSVKNAYKFTYQSSIIYYKTGKNAEADLVKSALSDHQCELINDDSIAKNYDIVVVVGKT